jgi:3-hydroxyisobutyrate dehydrogenase-like beta-hydroxyacid dehydrogenase
MARNLVAAGFEVRGVDALEVAVERAGAAGIEASPDLATLAGAEFVLSSLPDTPHVEAVYLGDGAVFDLVADGAVCADLSTLSVEASRRIAGQARRRGIGFLDTPVSGTIPHAEAATLAIMVGGESTDLDRIRPLLEPLSASIHHMGPSGAGLVMKLITNRLLAANMAALAEAMVDIENNGIDGSAGMEFLGASVVPKLISYKTAPLLTKDYRATFTVDLMRKDLNYGAALLGRDRIGPTTRQIFDEASARGFGDADISAIYETWES